MITITAEIMSRMPIPMLRVKGSPNIKIPTQTAVTGSMGTEVSVEPMLFTACTNARLEITVGINASSSRFPPVCQSGMA